MWNLTGKKIFYLPLVELDRNSSCIFCIYVSPIPVSSTSINKHWEAELAALKGNNAKLTAALLESTANVKQWKQQLAAYQEEAERLHKRVLSSSAQIHPTAAKKTKIKTDGTHYTTLPFNQGMSNEQGTSM